MTISNLSPEVSSADIASQMIGWQIEEGWRHPDPARHAELMAELRARAEEDASDNRRIRECARALLATLKEAQRVNLEVAQDEAPAA